MFLRINISVIKIKINFVFIAFLYVIAKVLPYILVNIRSKF